MDKGKHTRIKRIFDGERSAVRQLGVGKTAQKEAGFEEGGDV